ncbi:hypothetical protein FE257_007878 [Aspergillus nanangensis]|uniref:C6 transcription factor n=1 Tax=Aspergillus nanangensis TaxID=2582783 RepID=A0AAD4CX57_ASPNN|nr:hypothetical protein FE257_007878 [Aspergillus nanangensis]
MSPTPPSTTSSSAGGISPQEQYRVIRKRNRVPVSCAPCRGRKLKCNRGHPCENCLKRGDGSSCSYAQANSRKKHSPLQSASSSPDDMQNRIDRLESLVLSLMTNGSQSAGPGAAMAAISGNSSSIGSAQHTTDLDLDLDDDDGTGGPEESDTEQLTKSIGIMKVDNNKSYYISDAHWASVLQDITEVKNYFTTHKKQYEEHAEKIKAIRPPTDVPGSTLLFGGTKTISREEIMASFPSKYTTDILVARYFNYYDPSTHVLHGPTFQAQYNKHWEDPSKTCVVWIGMLFSMMRLAMLSYHREGDEPPEFRGKSLDMAGTYRNLMAQCLTLADYTKPYPYLIESLIFHLHGDFCQTKDSDVSGWVLVGVIARLAMRMGYHRDSKMFPNITPFQGEMRRRVWTFVRQADLLFSFQVGLPSMIRSSDSDTELPRNLYDDDFDEDCTELPPSRPPHETTPISFLIAKARLTYAFGRVVEDASSLQSAPYDKVMEMDGELRRAHEMIPEHLVVRSLEESQLDPANLIMSRYEIMSVYHKAQSVLHRRFIVRARENPRFTYSRRTCIDSAMELLRYQSMIHAETRPTGRLRSKMNRTTSLCSSDFLLAATIVCLDLYHGHQLQVGGRASGDAIAWGRERRDDMISALQRSKEIWDELQDETMDAWKASAVLGVMISQLNLGFSDGKPSVTSFEPQDEKQSAAMTLGLLSSGMSPMNPGPPGFNDGALKMETPLPPQGGFGPTGELAGAPSPFSTMFGQMPDMQVNLDWDAWDNYIQNSSVDFSNQWWPTVEAQGQTPGTGQNPLSPGQFSAAQASLAVVLQQAVTAVPRRLACFMHFLRRAACRLLSSPASSTPVRSTRIITPHSSSQTIYQCQLPQLALSRRWNSQNAPIQSQPSGERATTSSLEDERMVDAAVQYAEGEPRSAPVQSGESAELEADESQESESKRVKRLRLLNEEATPKETVYVGNLFYDVTAEDLRKQMEKYGIVEQVFITFDNRGISRGFGYVQFDSPESAKRAISAMHMRVFEGRRVYVQFAQNNIAPQQSTRPATRTLYVGNMAFEMTDRDLQDLFRDVVNVIDVRVSVERRTGQFKGFVHAEFTNVESARIGYETLSRKSPYGRKLRIDYSETNRRAERIPQVEGEGEGDVS